MRDLAKNSGSLRGPDKIVWQIAGIFLIISVIFFVKNNFLESSSGGSSVVLKDAPRGLIPVAVDSGGAADVGVDLQSKRISLRDVKYGGEARATASRSYGGGLYILSVDATLPDPVNTNYQVWLISDSGTLPIDYMRGTKTSWSLSLRDTDKYSKYGGIWITLERTKDNKPEEHVMEGTF